MIPAVRNDSAATTLAPVNGASSPLAVDSKGRVITSPSSANATAYTPGKKISAASTNATVVKASAGTLGYVTATNINASPRYLKLYDKATSPTVGTDTPVHTFLIPGNTSGSGIVVSFPTQGVTFTAGIGLAITTGVADSDTGAVAANELVINYGFV